MNPDQNILIHFLDTTDFYFYKLKNLINEIKTYSFYSKDYEDLIKILSDFNEDITKKFLNLKSNIYNQIKAINQTKKKNTNSIEIYDENFNTINRFNSFLRFFNKIISTFRNAENFYVHQGIFILIEEFTKKVTEQSKFIIYPFFPKGRVNYGFKNVSEILKNFNTTFLKGIKTEEMEKFLIFAIPTVNKEDILSNSLLGHEIGHFIYKEKKIRDIILENKFPFKVYKENYIKWIKEIQIKDPLIKDNLYGKTYSFIKWKNIISRWIEEITCDKIGLRLFGLSYFFAFVDFVYVSNPYIKGTQVHPPNWLRLKVLIDDIESKSANISKFINKFKINNTDLGEKINNKISFIKKNFASKNHESKKGSQKVPIESEISILKKFATDTINKRDFYHDLINEKLKKFKICEFYKYKFEDIQDLIGLLDQYVTPNEIINYREDDIRTVDIITILNAAWFYYLFNIGNHYKIFKNLTNMEVREKFNELILKAIELSKIQQRVNSILKKNILLEINRVFEKNEKKEIKTQTLYESLNSKDIFSKKLIKVSIDEMIREGKLIELEGEKLKLN